jgi:hypothetical protein
MSIAPSRKDFDEGKNVSYLQEFEQACREDLTALPCLQHPFNASQWEADMKTLAQRADQIPVIPPFAFTRESIYSNHD